MITKAFLRANIPFVFKPEKTNNLLSETAKKQGWASFEMHGDFLLKHINLSFANNVTCFSKKCDKVLEIPLLNLSENKTSCFYGKIGEVQVYFFGTGIGFCTIHLPFEGDLSKDTLTSIGSALYNSVSGAVALTDDGKMAYLDLIADSFLSELLNEYFLFGTANENALKRNNIFSCALMDGEDSEAYDRCCFQLANAYDNRDRNFRIPQDDLFHQHHYTRWGFSTRGSAAVANLTGNEATDSFLRERWFYSNQTNYFYLYLMVLHEKYATYHYLNLIAEDPNMDSFEMNQKLLLDFNYKYIFKIVSDEQLIQSTFMRFKEAANADDAYLELTDQLKKMFENAEYTSNKTAERKNQTLNLISIIISVVCFISVIFDTMSLFFSQGLSLGFDSMKNSIFTGGVLLEVVLFIVMIISVFVTNRKKK